MTKFAVNRSYVHRTLGQIGAVEFSADVRGATLNGQELPPESVEYLLNFALQSLQDAYAGADTLEDAKAAFNKRRERLMEGTIGVRTGGNGQTPLEAEILRIMRETIKAKVGKDVWKAEWADAADLDDRTQAVFNKQPEAFRADVTERASAALELKRKQAMLRAATADGLTL